MENNFNIDDVTSEDVNMLTDYDISANPNDFNVRTLVDFFDTGIVKIPAFQRNYVWDQKRASKLIESLLIGIPIPQIFLYEETRNNFLVVDGQQRYFTIYFFKKGRFPKKDKRQELRKHFEENCSFSDEILSNNEFFSDFKLQLPEKLPEQPNKFNGKTYETLEESDRITLDLRTIRNIIIKQNSSSNDNSAMFELFNRLNTGGVNLKPQEIRTSLYHSKFYEMLYDINTNTNWRTLIKSEAPDINMRDIEILLRGFAMLCCKDEYASSLTKFLNYFSMKAKSFDDNKISYLKNLFEEFVKYIISIDENCFINESTGRFNIPIFEAIFVSLCLESYRNSNVLLRNTTQENISTLKNNSDFITSTMKSTAGKKQIDLRIDRAIELL